MNTETKVYRFAESAAEAFALQGGGILSPVDLAYETYGTLSPKRDNAILLFHALSGSQHAAGYNPSVPGVDELWTDECQTGWWNTFVGPGKALDTDRFFVVCANYIGGCYGSTGPRSENPKTGQPYAGDFPRITLNDIVDSQLRLIDHLGIETLYATVGGSLGAMLSINLAVRYPGRVRKVAPMAGGLRTTILQRLHNFEQIFAIEEDKAFDHGFYSPERPPIKGLALARMISQKTFVSLHAIEQRSHGEIIQHEDDFKRYELTHQVESYMLHQGKKFVKRFDANTYLRILDAWQHMDFVQDTGAETMERLFAPCGEQEYLVFSIDSDVCCYPEEQEEIVQLLKASDVSCRYETVHSDKGHDSFLIEDDLYTDALRAFLEGPSRS